MKDEARKESEEGHKEEENRTLVGRPDFKSGEGRTTSLVGSTPTLFRHTSS